MFSETKLLYGMSWLPFARNVADAFYFVQTHWGNLVVKWLYLGFLTLQVSSTLWE